MNNQANKRNNRNSTIYIPDITELTTIIIKHLFKVLKITTTYSNYKNIFK